MINKILDVLIAIIYAIYNTGYKCQPVRWQMLMLHKKCFFSWNKASKCITFLVRLAGRHQWWGMISSLVTVWWQLQDTIFCHWSPCTWYSDQWVYHVWVRIMTYTLHEEFQQLVRVHGWCPFALWQHATMVGQYELVYLVKSALVTVMFHWEVYFYRP